MAFQIFEKKVIQVFNALKENKHIIIEEMTESFEDLPEATLKRYIEITEDTYKIKIPESYYPYLSSVDRIELKWKPDSEFDYTGGEFYLRDATGMFLNPLETYDKDNIPPDDAKLLTQGFRFFAFHNDDRSAIRIVNNEIESNVYFIPCAAEPLKLSLSYPEYMEQTLKARGFWGWQYLFTELKFSDFDFALAEDLTESFETLEIAFPEEDFSEYKARFENMK